MSLLTSFWRRGRRRCGLPVMLAGCSLAVIAVYDVASGAAYPLASLEPVMNSVLGPRTRHHHRVHRAQRRHSETEHKPADDDDQKSKNHSPDIVDPSIVHHENRPALAHPGGEVANHPGTAADPTSNAAVYLFEDHECRGTPFRFTALRNEHKCNRCFDACRASFPSGTSALNNIKSFRVVYDGAGEMPSGWSVAAYSVCGGTFAYSNEAMARERVGDTYRPESGCINSKGKLPNMFRFDGLPDPDSVYVPQSYHVVYSCESSTYFAYQAYANLYAFEHSNQQKSPKPGYTRLLTSSEEDDLSVANGGKVPTFTSPREPFSRMYSPYNKPTSLTAFMQSNHAPTEEVVVVIDPDNWIVRNIGPIAAKVRRGHAVATAAFYDGNPLVTELYQKHICEKACDFVPDTVAVPYFVHRDDAREIAPLWKTMTKKVWDFFQDPKHRQFYNSLQPGWCAEMYGYVFAAAELRVKHTILPNLQHRDVDGKITWAEAEKRRIRMIHMGRAWFNKDWAVQHASRWIHRPAWEYSPPGTEQVWCKCNDTAADERPWPLPPDIDWTSNVTLTTLYKSGEVYGNAPRNKYRVGYSGTYE